MTIETIGRYRVLGVLGKGAMGIVYKAVDPMIDRVVAIKTIRVSLSEEDLAFYEARFTQEVKTVGKLNHPNIVTIYDVGRTDQFAYMAMEFIEGRELKQIMTMGRPMDVSTAVQLASQVADGLAFAHSRDIVHRDVKPSNILVAENEEEPIAKITDFGIARVPISAVKTMTGTILGSPRYMSPEQVVGRNIGPRSDIFSLGVVLYEMLAGVAPFDADSVSSIMYQTVHVPPEPLASSNRGIPPALEALVSRALAKSPDDRFETMREFCRALREVARTLPEPRPLPREGDALVSDVTAPSSVADASADETARRLSSDFDSTAGTMRLAAFTEKTAEITQYLSKPPPPAAMQDPAPAASPASSPALSDTQPAPFPVGSAALLGVLGFIALALALVLAF